MWVGVWGISKVNEVNGRLNEGVSYLPQNDKAHMSLHSDTGRVRLL